MFRFLRRHRAETAAATQAERDLRREVDRLASKLREAEEAIRAKDSEIRIKDLELEYLAKVNERNLARIHAETAVFARTTAEAEGAKNAPHR